MIETKRKSTRKLIGKIRCNRGGNGWGNPKRMYAKCRNGTQQYNAGVHWESVQGNVHA